MTLRIFYEYRTLSIILDFYSSKDYLVRDYNRHKIDNGWINHTSSGTLSDLKICNTNKSPITVEHNECI